MSQDHHHIAYGSKSFPYPQTDNTTVITTPEVAISITAEKFFSMLIENESFQKLNLNNVIVVVADKTRLCGYPELLPDLVKALV